MKTLSTKITMKIICYANFSYSTQDTEAEHPSLALSYDCHLVSGEVLMAAVLSDDAAEEIADTLNTLGRARARALNTCDAASFATLAHNDTWGAMLSGAARSLIGNRLDKELGGHSHRDALLLALKDAAELLAEIMRDEVNHQDEAEKWLRAYAPEHLFPATTPPAR